MEKIILLCATGVTTSILTHQLTVALKDEALELEIEVCPLFNVADKATDAKMFLLTPQVRFNYNKISKMYPGMPVIQIENEEYANLDVQKIVKTIKANLG